jgi:hypothetical protein
MIDGLKHEKDLIINKIGMSPRIQHDSVKINESSSLSYREIEDDLSGESDRTKNARDQIRRMA